MVQTEEEIKKAHPLYRVRKQIEKEEKMYMTKIIVIEDGKIVEKGSHADLINKEDSSYQKIFPEIGEEIFSDEFDPNVGIDQE